MPERTSRSLFGGLFSRLFGAEPTAEAPAASPLEETGRSLDSVLRAVEDKVRLEHAEAEELQAATARSGPTREEADLARREASRARLQADIHALHRRLGTGLEPAELEALSTWMEQHAALLQAPPDSGIESRVDAQVLQRLFQRAGRLAWERLEELVAEAAVAWPVPQDLVIGRPPGDVPRVLEQHRRELETDFVGAGPGRCADLVAGEVRAWSHFYPDSTSALWNEVALRGVAAALRIELFSAMLEEWERRPPELESRLAEVLNGELSRARRLLDQGVQSLEQARSVTLEVERACSQVIPDMVWDFLGPRLRLLPNYPGAPSTPGGSATRRLG